MTGQEDHILTLAEMPPPEAAERLRAIGEDEAADALESAALEQPKSMEAFGGIGDLLAPLSSRPWWHTEQFVGYFPPGRAAHGTIPIISADSIEADPALKKTALRITLDRFYVAEYPGGSKHLVLLHFTLRNLARGRRDSKPVHLDTVCDVVNGEAANTQNYTIVTGLKVGNEGLNLECQTINVHSQDDQPLLEFLKSDIFTGGLKLISAIQPALAPLSEMAEGFIKMLTSRDKKNAPVFTLQLGLDFSRLQSRSFLAEGSYVVIQLSSQLKQLWNWDDWVYHVSSRSIINTSTQQRIPCNYFIFGISRYEGD